MNNFVGLAVVSFAMLGSACRSSEVTTSPPGVDIPIVRLRAEPYSFTFNSGFDQAARFVVRDGRSWEGVWAQTFRGGSVPPIPSIDFSREMVVVVALGTHSSGGYGILIDGASEAAAGAVAVAVRSISPGPGCGVTGALTQPVDFARVPRRNGAVRFVERSEVTQCK